MTLVLSTDYKILKDIKVIIKEEFEDSD